MIKEMQTVPLGKHSVPAFRLTCASSSCSIKRNLAVGISTFTISVALLSHAGAESIVGHSNPISRTNLGAKGASATSAMEAGAGHSATSFELNVTGTQSVSEQTSVPAVTVTSLGGQGGDGYNLPFDRWYRGGVGGRGGDLFLVHDASIPDQTGLHYRSAPLISLLSSGGLGGTRSALLGRNNRGPRLIAGDGGDGGRVEATLLSPLSLTGSDTAVVHITSAGGDSGGVLLLEPDPNARGYSFIGTGGAGAKAGPVSLKIGEKGGINAVGAYAPAVVVEALGGRGARSVLGSGLSFPGGSGGGTTLESPAVNFISLGAIATRGAHSPAVVLQSIGGNGGSGGRLSGVDGGSGGAGGFILARQAGSIVTMGDYSFGLFSQSVGGSGGNGASGIFNGNRGGAAGRGGDLNVANTGAITTNGANATALVAQSVGGGRALDALQMVPASNQAGGTGGAGGLLFFGSGGEGGGGGDGGTVTVSNEGMIASLGEKSHGILAQSIGGSGGGGGSATSYGILFDIALGGTGGAGGVGGSVEITTAPTVPPKTPSSITTNGNDSAGIVALSIGGGGGSGGKATARTLGAVVTVATAIGGTGGVGGVGGLVEVESGSTIHTKGSRSYGLQAMSVGGGGGAGGASVATAIGLGIDPRVPNIVVAHALGGQGGQGSTGGVVKVKNSGSIETAGGDASGILALSVGSGGGSGGLSDVASVPVALKDTASISVTTALGGTGTMGGTGGNVTVINDGRISTSGSQASGIAAFSIGGGGGAGGSAEILQSSVGKGIAIAVNGIIGGSGGKGNNGGEVTITQSGNVETSGFASNGIHALSVGGGGGTGGTGKIDSTAGPPGSLSSLSHLPKVAPKSLSINSVVGGSGDAGGNGNAVEVSNLGSVSTLGDDARGIMAQSIGGGGGRAAEGAVKSSNSITVSRAVGGSGGAAGLGGTVTVTNAAGTAIATAGDGAYAIHAQSVGGGGGSGGSASATSGESFEKALSNLNLSNSGKSIVQAILPKFAAKYKIKPSFPISASFSDTIGGRGGASGKGGIVTVTNRGNLSTTGAAASAIFAQSIGGGGGDGGSATVQGGKIINQKSALGGDGAGGGDGETVKIDHSGMIATAGQLSFGILAQSVGGGGGTSAKGVDKAEFDPLSFVGDAIPLLGFLHDVVGGTGGVSGKGGAVVVTTTGTIATFGDEAHGLVAQSVGGGGGVTLTNVLDPYAVISLRTVLTHTEQDLLKGVGIDVGKEIAQAETDKRNDHTQPIAKHLTLGGSNASGNGGVVEVHNGGSIGTSGTAAFGILAQSIGAGGGLAGNSAMPSNMAIGGLGGSNGAKGDGQAVSVEFMNTSRIATTGLGSHAVFLQSIGGGGGYGGTASGPSDFVRDGKTSGDGGAVTVKMAPGAKTDIATSGQAAHGIFAQSLGAGGGFVTDLQGGAALIASNLGSRTGATGKGGRIAIDVDGTIATSGANSYAIFAQTGVQKADGTIDSGRRTGKIEIGLGGRVSGGSEGGVGVRLDGGAGNLLTLRSGALVTATSGAAVMAVAGGGTIANDGTIAGTIDAPNYMIYNFQGGTLVTGAMLNLGPGSRLSNATSVLLNAGTLNVGGVGRVTRTELTGRYDSTDTSRILVDVAPLERGALRNDVLAVSGTATVHGTVQPNVIGGLLPGQYTFLTAERIERADAAASETKIHSGSIPVSWAIIRSENSLALTPTANFVSPLGMTLTDDQKAAGQALQHAWDAGTIGSAGMFARFLSVESKTRYADALADLSQESSQYALTGRALDTRAGLKRAMSCPAFDGTDALLREGECVWGRVNGTRTSLFSSHDEGGYRQTALSYQIGAQTEFAPDWFLGTSVAYTRAAQSDSDRITGSVGDAGDVSIALKHQAGPWLLAASANLGYAWQSNVRSISIGNSSEIARSRSEILSAGGRLRASYQLLFDRWYIKPYADLDVLYTHSPAYSESGAPGLNLDVRGVHKTLMAFSPNVEIGGRFNLDTGRWIRPFGTVGMTFLSDDHFNGIATLQGTNGLGVFATRSRIPDQIAEAGLGLQMWLGNGIEITGEYQAHAGDRFLSHTGNARLSVRF